MEGRWWGGVLLIGKKSKWERERTEEEINTGRRKKEETMKKKGKVSWMIKRVKDREGCREGLMEIFWEKKCEHLRQRKKKKKEGTLCQISERKDS